MKKTIIPFLASAMLAGCASEDIVQQPEDENFSEQVILAAELYTFENGTRTALEDCNSYIDFIWETGDSVGFFSVDPTTDYRAMQVLNVSEPSHIDFFDGKELTLLKGKTYAAYTPYRPNTDEKGDSTVLISMTGQIQDGNAHLYHISGKYDYMYATATVPSQGNVTFAFNHVGSIIKLNLTMPEAGTWTHASLTGTDDVFTTSATMNIYTGALTPVSKSSTISLDLKNISTTAAGQTIILYISALPCTTGPLTLTVTNSDGKEYTKNLDSKIMHEGMAYSWKTGVSAPFFVSGIENGYDYVDLGLSVKWAAMNVGATSVPGYGAYFAWGEVTGCQCASDSSCIEAIMDGYPSSWTGSTNSSYVSGDPKFYYDLNDYKWGIGNTMFKYTSNSDKTLDAEDDAAAVNWGGGWRMPTYAEMEELKANCYWVFTDNYNFTGIPGFIVYKAKNDKDKGVDVNSTRRNPLDCYTLSDNHIFLPSAGSRCYKWFDFNNSGLWSSSRDGGANSYFLEFQPNWGAYLRGLHRSYGLPVRAVCQ